MLLALWPLFITHSQPHHAGQGGGTAQRGQYVARRAAAAQEAAEAHLQRLQEVDHGTGFAGSAGGEVALAGIPDSHQPVGDVAVRLPQHERTLAGRIPEALGTSIAASDAIPFELDQAMKRYAAKQAADEDDEMAMIIILAGM